MNSSNLHFSSSSSSSSAFRACMYPDVWDKLKLIQSAFIREDPNYVRRMTIGYKSMYSSINQRMYNRIRASRSNNTNVTMGSNDSVTLDDGWIDNKSIHESCKESGSDKFCCMTSKVLNHRYKIIQMVGKGSFSQVYEAYDTYHPHYKDTSNSNKIKTDSTVPGITEVNHDRGNRNQEGADKVVIKIVRRGYHVMGIREHVMLQHLAAATGTYGGSSSSSSTQPYYSSGRIHNQFFLEVRDVFQFDNHCCLVLNSMSATLFDFLCQPRPPSPSPTTTDALQPNQSHADRAASASASGDSTGENRPLNNTASKLPVIVPVIKPRVIRGNPISNLNYDYFGANNNSSSIGSATASYSHHSKAVINSPTQSQEQGGVITFKYISDSRNNNTNNDHHHGNNTEPGSYISRVANAMPGYHQQQQQSSSSITTHPYAPSSYQSQQKHQQPQHRSSSASALESSSSSSSSCLEDTRSVEVIRKIAFHLISCLCALRHENIIHGDIKPENVFIHWHHQQQQQYIQHHHQHQQSQSQKRRQYQHPFDLKQDHLYKKSKIHGDDDDNDDYDYDYKEQDEEEEKEKDVVEFIKEEGSNRLYNSDMTRDRFNQHHNNNKNNSNSNNVGEVRNHFSHPGSSSRSSSNTHVMDISDCDELFNDPSRIRYTPNFDSATPPQPDPTQLHFYSNYHHDSDDQKKSKERKAVVHMANKTSSAAAAVGPAGIMLKSEHEKMDWLPPKFHLLDLFYSHHHHHNSNNNIPQDAYPSFPPPSHPPHSYQSPIVCLGDFGNAIHLSEVSDYYDDFNIQSLPYRAPEVLLGLPFTTQIDVWSVGIILVELLIQKPLFLVTNRVELYSEIKDKIGIMTQNRFCGGKYSSLLYSNDYGTTDGNKNNNNNNTSKSSSSSSSMCASLQLLKIAKLFESSSSNSKNTNTNNTNNNTNDAISIGGVAAAAAVTASSNTHLLIHFLSSLLQVDPDLRLTPMEALTHPFLHSCHSLPLTLFTAMTSASGGYSSSSHQQNTVGNHKKRSIAMLSLNKLHKAAAAATGRK